MSLAQHGRQGDLCRSTGDYARLRSTGGHPDGSRHAWWHSNSACGLTRCSTQLIEQGIEVLHGRFRHPQTPGKVETLHHAPARDLRHHRRPETLASAQSYFDGFRQEYNCLRPHRALALGVPADYYRTSSRSCQPSPALWTYPADYQAVRLNSEGSMDYHGVRCCVAKTLARQTVGVPEADAKLPVQYRGRYIREIDLTTGKSRAFDRPHHDIPMVSGMS